MSYPERKVRYVGKMISHVKKMQEALGWLERNPKSRIASEKGSPCEEDGALWVAGVDDIASFTLDTEPGAP